MPGLYAEEQRGAASRLAPEQEQKLIKWLENLPNPGRGSPPTMAILRETIQQCFGKLYWINDLLHSRGYNDLMPRTMQPDTDPVVESFKKRISRGAGKGPGRPSGQPFLIYYQDEARFGRYDHADLGQGRHAACGIQQNQYDYRYVFAALCPQTGEGCLIAPEINIATMNAFLEESAKQLPPMR